MQTPLVHCPPEVISEIFFQALPDDPQHPISVDAAPILFTRVLQKMANHRAFVASIMEQVQHSRYEGVE
ncbi:hypothetical protein EW146_g9000 [Bondarzewia mesenterica]|uniref:Uncharacterized protein n=1 Tax=Bondarzewia mesenterica TaxID=1095465 RepID=A0A4S4LA21_9AGAM|nr:hypothetical protein EW146_g9000 [Bondarzewia mesenterica]